MPPLPMELVEEIIDIVAERCPESLPDCALVSQRWNPRSTYHLYRIFRTPRITSLGTLNTFSDIVERHPRVAKIATSLEIAPNFELDLAYASYIPFHRLSSRILPNVLRMVLGENLRWGDYPLVYRKGTIAGFFDGVIALDLSCHFTSVSNLFRVIRSFRNVKDVRLLYSHHDPPRWIFYQTHNPRPRHDAFSLKAFRLEHLELSLTILKPVLNLQELIQTFAEKKPYVDDSCPECSEHKEALLVGISYATNLNENEFPILAGTHKDTMNLRRLLTRRYDYRDEDITTLVDSDDAPHESWPTRDNIIRAMERLISGKKAGDHIVFSFSGHAWDLVDGRNKFLLPVDFIFNPQSPDHLKFKNFIRDDEIRNILVNQLPEGVRCTMIFDCIHSGTMSGLPIVELPVSREMTPPGSPLFSSRYTELPRMETLHDIPRSFDKEVTSWSACKDDEITFGKKSGGIFMKAFTQVLHSTPNLTHKELLKYLRKRILHVTEEANQKRRVRGDLFEYVAPIPQLGSLRPDSILLAQFTL
ncbi:caspase domain-containing protein [Ganoderma leucocontextum]|nr:caspase domain-containing protein [Ganoderma leucocontextum]